MRLASRLLSFAVLLPSLSLLASDAATPLPLDLAFSRREVWRGMRPALSPDGHYVAYEIRTPLPRTVNGSGETEARFLPGGFPTIYDGVNLWVSDTETGESHSVCKAGPCWRGSWSPSSRQLAYYSNESGAPALWIYDVASRGARRIGPAVVKVKIVRGDAAVWSRDGRTIYAQVPPPARSEAGKPSPQPVAAASRPSVAVLRTRAQKSAAPRGHAEGDGEEINAFIRGENEGSFVAIDVASGSERVVIPYDAVPPPSAIRLSPDGKWLSYLSIGHVVSAASAAQDVLEDLVVLPAGGGAPLLTVRDIHLPDDESLEGSYRWTPDSRRIVYVRDSDLWLTNVAEGAQPQRLGASLGRITGSPLYLTRDGNAAVISIDSPESATYDFGAPRGLAVVPLDGRAPRVLDLLGVPIPADATTVWQPSAGTIAVLRTLPDALARELVEVDLQSGKATRLWSGMGRLNPVGVVSGRNLLVSRFEGPSTAPDLVLFDRKLTPVRRLSNAEPRLEGIRVGSVESFSTVIGGPDGKLLTVQSRVLLPFGAKREDHLPTVVYFYSGAPFAMYAHDYGGGAPSSIPVQIFTSRGYAVLLCDVPLGPQGKPGNPVQEMTDAILAQVRHAADLGYTDIARVAIMGQSYGAYSTAAITTRTNLFRAAIALDGMYDLASVYGTGGEGDVAWAEGGQGRMGASPWADIGRYIANSPYYQADKIHTPLLLIHGEKDGACPVVEAKKMFNALKRLDRDAELAVYAGEGHVTGRWALPNAVDAAQRMLDFLATHLKD